MPVFKDPDAGPTPLHRLLLRVAPRNSQGNLSLTQLGEDLGYSRIGLQHWLKTKRVSPAVAQKIIDYDQSREPQARANVTRADFEPFVYNG